jgi:hypothetical protein
MFSTESTLSFSDFSLCSKCEMEKKRGKKIIIAPSDFMAENICAQLKAESVSAFVNNRSEETL